MSMYHSEPNRAEPSDAGAFAVVINDGQFVWPARAADIQRWAVGQNRKPSGTLSVDEYRDLCDTVKAIDGLKVGSQDCIDRCASLVDAGAREWAV